MKISSLFATVLFAIWSLSAHGTDDLIPHEFSFSENSNKTHSGIGSSFGLSEEGEKNGIKYVFFHSDGSANIAGSNENNLSKKGLRKQTRSKRLFT